MPMFTTLRWQESGETAQPVKCFNARMRAGFGFLHPNHKEKQRAMNESFLVLFLHIMQFRTPPREWCHHWRSFFIVSVSKKISQRPISQVTVDSVLFIVNTRHHTQPHWMRGGEHSYCHPWAYPHVHTCTHALTDKYAHIHTWIYIHIYIYIFMYTTYTHTNIGN